MGERWRDDDRRRHLDRAVSGRAHAVLVLHSVPSPVIRNMWKLACFVENEGVNTMAGDTILYISDQAANSDSELAAPKPAGHEVVSTNTSTQPSPLPSS